MFPISLFHRPVTHQTMHRRQAVMYQAPETMIGTYMPGAQGRVQVLGSGFCACLKAFIRDELTIHMVSYPRHSIYPIYIYIYAYIRVGLGGQCRHIWHTWSVWVLQINDHIYCEHRLAKAKQNDRGAIVSIVCSVCGSRMFRVLLAWSLFQMNKQLAEEHACRHQKHENDQKQTIRASLFV